MSSNTRRIAFILAMLMVLLGLFVWNSGDARQGRNGKQSLITAISEWFQSRRTGTVSEEPRRRSKSRDRAKAEETTGPEVKKPSCVLTGIVKNEVDERVKEAKITLRGVGTTFNQSFQTNDEGEFEATGMPEGTYDILAAHPKYATLVRPNFTMKLEEPAFVEFRLPLGATVKGLVVDEEGKPIVGVRVGAHRRKMEQLAGGGKIFLDDSTYKTTVTDKDGTFSLAGVAMGENVIESDKAGYEQDSRTLKVQPDKVDDQVKITLKKTGFIAGTVVDEAGKPISTATVSLTRYKGIGGPYENLQKEKFSVISDTSGTFKLSKLFNEGFYDVSVEHADYAPGIFPLVAAGTEQLTCMLERGGAISGRTEFIDRPSTPAVILLAAQTVIKGTTFTKEIKTEATGQFFFTNLPYGTYNLYADSHGIVSEPKTDVPSVKDKPTRGVLVEVYEAAVVRGRVSNAENNAPIGGAKVSVQASYGMTTPKSRTFESVTDSHGEFEVRRLPSGVHVASASAENFMRTANGSSAQTFTLQPGEEKNDVALRLDHGGSVEGFVLDKNGRAVRSAEVQLFAASGTSRPERFAKMKCNTDDTGYFKLWGFEVSDRDQLYASAQKKGYTKTRSDIITLTAKKPDGSTQIVLAAGGAVAGRVTDEAKMPVPGAEVKFVTNEFPGDPSSSQLVAYTASDGSYQVSNCTPGSARITVSRSGFVQQGKDVQVTDAKLKSNVDFTLSKGFQITGRVATLEGDPIAGAKVRASPLGGAKGTDEAITDKKGEYTLTNLGAGQFNLEATFTLGTADGQQNYAFRISKIASGTNGAFIDCDVDNNAAGQVYNDENKAVDKFKVVLRSRADTKPTQDFTFNVERNLNAARGFYRVVNIPRGVYTMSVTADGYEPLSLPNVAIGPHKRTTFPKLKLKSAGGIMGSVVSSSTNRPINDVTVKLIEVTKGKSAPATSSGKSDYSGRFRLSSVPAGTYRLELEHPSYLAKSVEPVSVRRQRSTDLGEYSLDAGGTIQGTITEDDGTAVAGASVKVSGAGKETRTDYAGNFLLQGVQPGRWPVVVRANVNSRSVYSFSTVGVFPDETARADFMLETSADLDGVLTAFEGAVRSGNVSIRPFDENSTVLEDVHYDATASGERFSIKQVPPGHYFVHATGFGPVASYAIWQVAFLERGPNLLKLMLPTNSIGGRVTDSADAPLSGVNIVVRPDLGTIRLPQTVYDLLVRAGFTDQNGRFLFANLVPGTHQVLYLDPTGVFGGRWVAMPPVPVGPNSQIDNIDIKPGQ